MTHIDLDRLFNEPDSTVKRTISGNGHDSDFIEVAGIDWPSSKIYQRKLGSKEWTEVMYWPAT